MSHDLDRSHRTTPFNGCLSSARTGASLKGLLKPFKGKGELQQFTESILRLRTQVAELMAGMLAIVAQSPFTLLDLRLVVQHSAAVISAAWASRCGAGNRAAHLAPAVREALHQLEVNRVVLNLQVEFGRARWPEDLKLSPAERRMASQAMRPLEPEQQQAVINEAAVRCARGEIRKPVAYLMGLFKRACRGEFNLWAARSDTTAPEHTPRRPSASVSKPEPPRECRQPGEQRTASPLALACLEELKQRCRVPSAST